VKKTPGVLFFNSVKSHPVSYRYRPEVLAQLLRHGVRPTTKTPPGLVHEYVNDLYRYELRRLRSALVRGDIPKKGYYDRVVQLRLRYPLVSLKSHLWVE
jgi:hypothetical protein